MFKDWKTEIFCEEKYIMNAQQCKTENIDKQTLPVKSSMYTVNTNKIYI